MTTFLHSLPFLLAAPEGSSAGSGGSMVTTFITFGLIIVVFYFLIIRPQRKREKETKAMISAVKKGDKVVTIGGIRGTVISVKEQTIVIKVDDNTKIEFNKSAVSGVVEKKEASASKPAKKSAASSKKIAKANTEAGEETETEQETKK